MAKTKYHWSCVIYDTCLEVHTNYKSEEFDGLAEMWENLLENTFIPGKNHFYNRIRMGNRFAGQFVRHVCTIEIWSTDFEFAILKMNERLAVWQCAETVQKREKMYEGVNVTISTLNEFDRLRSEFLCRNLPKHIYKEIFRVDGLFMDISTWTHQ